MVEWNIKHMIDIDFKLSKLKLLGIKCLHGRDDCNYDIMEKIINMIH